MMMRPKLAKKVAPRRKSFLPEPKKEGIGAFFPRESILHTVPYLLLAALFLFNVIMLCVIATMQEAPPQAVGGVVLDPNATDERPGEGQSSMPGVTVAGFSSLTIPPELTTVPIDLYNPIENNGLYYITFEFRLFDEEGESYEVLFKTGYVAPGKHIYQVELAHGLPAGEYTAQLFIQPYCMSNLSPTNNVSAIVALTVK